MSLGPGEAGESRSIPALSRRLPIPPTLSGYRRSWLPRDVLAGLTVWAVLVPESLAYATIAGVSPVVGLYAAAPALVFYALLGSSRQLVVGPMSATAALSAAAVGTVAASGSSDFVTLTAALAITTGIAALLAGVLRLGFVASFISEPVLKGFIIGIALTIIVGQLPKLFGVEGGSGEFFEQMWHFLKELGNTNGWTLMTGTASLAVLLVLRRLAPIVPAALAAVVFGVLAQKLLDLCTKGVHIVGPIEAGLPSFGFPDVGWSGYVSLMGSALGILLIAFSEGIAGAKAYAVGDGGGLDPNRELLGLGASNLASGLSSGMVVNGSLSKTAVNAGAGARSQVSGLFVAALTVLTLLFFTGLFEDLPEATLAAIVIAAVVELVDLRALQRLYEVYTSWLGEIYGPVARPDLIAAVAALSGVLVLGTLPGLFVGITVSVLLIIYRASRPHVALLGRDGSGAWVDVDRHPDAQRIAGILVVRPESPLFYANADNFLAAVRGRITEGTTAVVIDAEAVAVIDVTAATMLQRLNEELSARNVSLVMARGLGQVRDVMRETSSDELVEIMRPSIDDAIADLRDD